jgi:hypothetical protein
VASVRRRRGQQHGIFSPQHQLLAAVMKRVLERPADEVTDVVLVAPSFAAGAGCMLNQRPADTVHEVVMR